MAVRIRLLRMGKIRNPQYRIVVADSRTKRDGRAIEFIGRYHPKEEPSLIEVNPERAAYWLSVGAQPSEPVIALLSKTGDWQKFKGQPAPPPLLVKAPKADKLARYESEAKAALSLGEPDAADKPKKAAKKAPAKKATAEKASADKAETQPVEAKPADTDGATQEQASAPVNADA